jgi:hypothetical protein
MAMPKAVRYATIAAQMHALFGICLFTTCRIRKACTLRRVDAYDAQGRVVPKLQFFSPDVKTIASIVS